ncbi:MAG: tRNA (cytidine(34)-2'-O)-methyltransferase [Betaproteobacteria bacterium]|nr:tRNA (cytidine(34)-2'-O)-methyltransferase [Betaproteobacteria bacterium]
MLEIVLFEPEIPPNTGNAIRLCANAGCRMHLVHPLGFSLRDKLLRRAGLDYRDFAEIVQHEDWRACRSALEGRRLFAVTTRGARRYDAPRYREHDVFVFGPETRGLPAEVLAEFSPGQRIRLPMRNAGRSLNLSNAVAIVIYEAWRQLGFRGGR